ILPFALSLGALHHLPATRVSIVAMVEVVLASIVAWVWLEETLSAAQLAGGAIVLTGILLASPRGYCAGVERAVETVERALEHYGAPVYVRKQIVHNLHVVRDLEARGAIFVDD